MKLCIRDCESCPVQVMIRIDYKESKYSQYHIDGIVAHRSILDLYDRLLENLSIEDEDIAVVLNVSGADVALACSHLIHPSGQPVIELF